MQSSEEKTIPIFKKIETRRNSDYVNAGGFWYFPGYHAPYGNYYVYAIFNLVKTGNH